MTDVQQPLATPAARPSGAWAGWVTFAAVVLTLLGTLHALQGFIALFDDGYFAVAVVFVDVILQIGFLPAYPVWSALLILLDVLVIFALTARWPEARAAM